MSHKIVNLTLPVVLGEVENFLEEYPDYSYKVAFSVEEFKQKLVAYILSNVPNRYTVIDDSQEPIKDVDFVYSPFTERLYIENLIHGGILRILRENADSVDFMIAKKDYSLN